VEPPGLFEQNQQQQFLLKGLLQWGQICQGRAVERWLSPEGDGQDAVSSSGDGVEGLVAWSAIAAQSQFASLSVAAMSGQGVDVVLEMPEHLSPRLVVSTAGRRLSARSLLIAAGTVPKLPDLLSCLQSADQITLVGGTTQSVLWAEALAVAGLSVCLESAQWLPGEDDDVARLVRSRLISLGIDTGLFSIPSKSAQSCDPTATDFTVTFESAEPVLALPNFVYSREAKRPYLWANRYLQTAHPRVFACGAALGGSASSELAAHEADIAVRNALFCPRQRVDYTKFPLGCAGFGRIGLTPAQARRFYGSAVQVWQASSANAADLGQVAPLPNYCKLVTWRDRLLGVHLFGEGSDRLLRGLRPGIGGDLGGAIASQNGWISSTTDQSLESVCWAAVNKASQAHWQPGQWRRDWAENWFNWRRSR
jgi:pyruvate/2-oxoglutarate dehydrogenase complex dihydrolipoamide dehydrogenase (E3) component